MGFRKDFQVNIIRLTSAVAQKGFGTILILSDEQDHELTVYNTISDISADFESTTNTYQMASDLFGQGVDEVLIVGVLEGAGNALVDKLNEVVKTNDNFFGIVATDNSNETILGLSEWVNTQEKVYAVTSSNLEISNESDQTIIAYHPEDNLAEKSLAYMLTREIGSVDLDGKLVPNITLSGVDATEYATLKENNINVAVEKFGNIVVDGGDMAGGEKIDIILSEFWIKVRMEEDLAQLKANTLKIPYTNAGVALLIDVANTRLKMASLQGIIALDDDGIPEYEVTYLPVEEVPESERANRVYDYVKWSAKLAGSIREGEIEGVLTI